MLGLTLGSFGGHFGMSLGWVTLGWRWDHFGVTDMDTLGLALGCVLGCLLRVLWDYLGDALVWLYALASASKWIRTCQPLVTPLKKIKDSWVLGRFSEPFYWSVLKVTQQKVVIERFANTSHQLRNRQKYWTRGQAYTDRTMGTFHKHT